MRASLVFAMLWVVSSACSKNQEPEPRKIPICSHWQVPPGPALIHACVGDVRSDRCGLGRDSRMELQRQLGDLLIGLRSDLDRVKPKPSQAKLEAHVKAALYQELRRVNFHATQYDDTALVAVMGLLESPHGTAAQLADQALAAYRSAGPAATCFEFSFHPNGSHGPLVGRWQ